MIRNYVDFFFLSGHVFLPRAFSVMYRQWKVSKDDFLLRFYDLATAVEFEACSRTQTLIATIRRDSTLGHWIVWSLGCRQSIRLQMLVNGLCRAYLRPIIPRLHLHFYQGFVGAYLVHFVQIQLTSSDVMLRENLRARHWVQMCSAFLSVIIVRGRRARLWQWLILLWRVGGVVVAVTADLTILLSDLR